MNDAGAGPPNVQDQMNELAVFKRLFAAYPDALVVADSQGTVVLANPAASLLLGYADEELVGLNVDALVPSAIRPKHASYREHYGRHPRPRPMGSQMELAARRKDGSEVVVEISLSPLLDHGLPYVVAAIRDIGSYPRVKQALQRARYSEYLARLGSVAVDARDPQVVLDQAPLIAAEALQWEVASVFLLEADRKLLRVAAGVGLVPGERVGTVFPFDPESSPGLVLSKGIPLQVADYRTEGRFTVPRAYLDDGLVSGLSVPVQDRGRTIGALTVRSRTLQTFGDEEVRFMISLATLLATSLQRAQSEEALNHAQRLESVGQLTGGIAHDFNNLLTVIQGNLQVLDELPELAASPYARQLVEAAVRASRRGAELTGKLLAFSRRQVLQPTSVDVVAMLQSLANMLRRTLDQRIRIEVDAAPGCPPVQADAGQLEAALLNIAINARDAMPDGGSLYFRASACGALPAELSNDPLNPIAPDRTFVRIAVSDTGSGMSDDVRERAFEPFFTTKELGRGTGLGLSTVYGFVKQSSGVISIESEPGSGTTLTLYLPEFHGAGGRSSEEDATSDTVPAGLAVLLVEDDAEVRDVVRAFLNKLGCAVTAASSAEQALLALQGDRFDLLLSDIALGAGMRGTALAARAQELQPALAVLLMSGFSAELLQADRESPDSWELLRKPFSRTELAHAIAKLVA
jgi:PAS domain S-box-containing protein